MLIYENLNLDSANHVCFTMDGFIAIALLASLHKVKLARLSVQ